MDVIVFRIIHSNEYFSYEYQNQNKMKMENEYEVDSSMFFQLIGGK